MLWRFAVLTVVVMSVAVPCHADDRVTAKALFDEGRQLMDQGKFDQACEKLAESYKLSGGVGAQFNLAKCNEKRGHWASAWSHYREVAQKTDLAGQKRRSREADKRVQALEPRLTKLLIEVSAPVEGLTVTVNGNEVGSAQWGTAVPVDPDRYRVAASAPGFEPWEEAVEALEPGKVVVSVPALEAKPPSLDPAAGRGNDADDAESSAQLVTGITLTAVGIVGIGVGAAFGGVAIKKHDDQAPFCRNDVCVAEGKALNDEARTAGTISTAAIVVGSAALVTGVVLWALAPAVGDQDSALVIVPNASPSSAGLAVAGSF